MSQNNALYNSVAPLPLRNVAALATLIERARTRAHSLPGMATFYGPSGFGKTTAALFSTNKFRAVTVQVKSTWTAKHLCKSILTE
ncbi:Holliday junction ATP-dependent DNA helicase RuvB, partial [Profundibacterium mesophilum KAUST100406-0324]